MFTMSNIFIESSLTVTFKAFFNLKHQLTSL
jgi:hypothetical protein